LSFDSEANSLRYNPAAGVCRQIPELFALRETGLRIIGKHVRTDDIRARTTAPMINFNLPNRLTLSRIVIVPVIVGLLMCPGRWTCLVASLLFVAAGLTDLMDGRLARQNNQITNLGKFLDPLADKILVNSVLIMLVGNGWVPGWAAVIIICRDVMVMGLRAIAADEGMVIAADVYGKLKTVLQIVALVPLIVHYDTFGIPVHSLGMIVLYISLALTVFSGYNYFATFYRTWRGRPAG
jgi:CDP-diacylglycerol--glycerol-3-phosphate 3-phosphatidyltransferase